MIYLSLLVLGVLANKNHKQLIRFRAELIELKHSRVIVFATTDR
jgi:hypothetical protein